jgi:hypothetical protein
MEGVLSWLGLSCRYKKFFVLPWLLCALVSPVKNIFFLHRTLFRCLAPHRPASWAATASRAGSPVSYCVCLWVRCTPSQLTTQSPSPPPLLAVFCNEVELNNLIYSTLSYAQTFDRLLHFCVSKLIAN